MQIPDCSSKEQPRPTLLLSACLPGFFECTSTNQRITACCRRVPSCCADCRRICTDAQARAAFRGLRAGLTEVILGHIWEMAAAELRVGNLVIAHERSALVHRHYSLTLALKRNTPMHQGRRLMLKHVHRNRHGCKPASLTLACEGTRQHVSSHHGSTMTVMHLLIWKARLVTTMHHIVLLHQHHTHFGPF